MCNGSVKLEVKILGPRPRREPLLLLKELHQHLRNIGIRFFNKLIDLLEAPYGIIEPKDVLGVSEGQEPDI